MASTKPLKVSFKSRSFTSLWGEAPVDRTYWSTTSHRCSNGLGFGAFGGQGNTLNRPACRHSTLHPGAITSPDKWPSMWCKRKRDSSDQTTFFHWSKIQFWCLRALCRWLWWWTGVIIGTLTDLQLRSLIHSRVWCTVCCDTFLP